MGGAGTRITDNIIFNIMKSNKTKVKLSYEQIKTASGGVFTTFMPFRVLRFISKSQYFLDFLLKVVH